MHKKMKRREFRLTGLQTRSESEGGTCYIEGYFAVFNRETELWDGWFEQIASGAFAESLRDNDIRCLFNHHPDAVLGRTSSGTLTLREDAKGLWGSVAINPDDQQAMDVYARVMRGDITGCSFGFYPTGEEVREDPDGSVHFTVTKADTQEVSVCTFPAYEDTDIAARKRDMEHTEKEKLAQAKEQARRKLEEMKKC